MLRQGVRRPALEHKVIAEIATRLGVDRWGVFVELDSCFENIANGGDERLARSSSA